MKINIKILIAVAVTLLNTLSTYAELRMGNYKQYDIKIGSIRCVAPTKIPSDARFVLLSSIWAEEEILGNKPPIQLESKIFTVSAMSEVEERLNCCPISRPPPQPWGNENWVVTLSAKVIPPTTSERGTMIGDAPVKILELYKNKMFVLDPVPLGVRGSDIRVVKVAVDKDQTGHNTITLDIEWSYAGL